MTALVQYHLLSLEFRGTRKRAMFNGALLKHAGNKVVILPDPAYKGRKASAATAADFSRDVQGAEIKSIRYKIEAVDPRTKKPLSPAVTFCHPVPRGTFVLINMDPDSETLFLKRDGGKKFFSDDFLLSDALHSVEKTRQRVFQFHE